MVMKRIVFPSRAGVVLGLVLFVVGLLVVVRENPLFSGVSAIVPDAQSALVFGAVMASVGQSLVVFGVVKASSDKLYSNLQSERQLTMTALARNMEQMQVTMQNERKAVLASYAQTMTKLDRLAANQKELDSNPPAALPADCKYCGAKIQNSTFCPQCGKANQ